MGFFLLGIDSFIACMAVGAIVDRRWRLPLAAFFGLADAAAFLIGAGLGWTISGSVTGFLGVGTLAVLACYLIVVAAGSRLVTASWAVWALPFALTMDNLVYRAAGDPSGSLAGHAAEQALSSALLALVGLYAASLLPRMVPALQRRTVAVRFAGVALLAVTGAVLLIG
jgi:hypothetical protein